MEKAPSTPEQSTLTQHDRSRRLYQWYKDKNHNSEEMDRAEQIEQLRITLKGESKLYAGPHESRNDDIRLETTLRNIRKERAHMDQSHVRIRLAIVLSAYCTILV